MNLRTLHLVVGTLGLILFALQGQYMANVVGVPDLSDTQRLLYRSAHIYFMLACAVNIALGCFMTGDSWLQRLCSVLLLIAPVMLLVSFFTEINDNSIDRILISLALYAIFAAVALLATRALLQRFKGAGQD